MARGLWSWFWIRLDAWVTLPPPRFCLVSSLAEQLAAAKAAYAANPTVENKAIAVDLVRQVAAAKKAEEPKVDLQALAQQARAAQANREQAGKVDVAINRAKRMYEEAHEYPRCGESWPFGAKEEAAMALLIKTAREQL